MSRTLAAFAMLAVVFMSATHAATTTAAGPAPGVSDSKAWTGDFDGMFQRRHIRILVPYSRTLYYVENGKEHGLTVELARDFETYLNKKHAKELGGRPLSISVVATTRDKLLAELTAGRGDIAGGNLTATPARLKTADFVAPTERDPAHEVLVSGPGAAAVASLDDLSGRRVNVRQSSSYYESLVALNEKLAAAKKPAVQIVTVPDALEDEDVLELLNAGLFEYTVVDSWKATLWGQTLPKIKVHDAVVLRNSGTIGWAIRKHSPGLQAEIEGFYKTAAQQGLIENRLVLYRDRIKELSRNTTPAALQHFDRTMMLFRQNGAKDSFVPLMLAAEGFTEAQLGHSVAGQPAAATSPSAPPSGEALGRSIHAGEQYEEQLKTRYFADARFSDIDRTLFTFAAYNAGAGRIAEMRKQAASRGLDPDQWFNNVELVTAEKLGTETTNYVRVIYKYGVAYQLITAGGATAKGQSR